MTSPEVRRMVSPLVRRRRLAAELVALRRRHGYPAHRVAAEIGVGRQSISRLENGHVAPDLNEVMKILDLFDVDQQTWVKIMAIARDAQERGWWARYTDQMGPRQALYADLEAGAASICEYQMTFLPGLLQVPPYTEARLRAELTDPTRVDMNRALEARSTRQRVLERPDGPIYEVILDELAVRRPAAPRSVVGTQLDHLVNIGHHHEGVTVRVLPTAAHIAGHAIPRSAFFCYRYPDPDDPSVVAVDTVTSDLVLTSVANPAEVTRYLDLYQRLRDAALAPDDSLDFLITVAEEIAHQKREVAQ